MSRPPWIERILQRLLPSGSLVERALKSGAWESGLNVVDRVIRLSVFVFLARLLSPAAFGLLGLGLLTVTVLRTFSQFGLDAALVQRDIADDDAYLNTAWVVGVVRGVAIAAAAYVLAPTVASVFGDPQLTAVVRVLALSPLVTGLRNPGIAYLEKNLAFHRRFVYVITGTAAYTVIAIVGVSVSQTVWALVAATTGGAVARAVVSYAVHPHRPRPQFDVDAARDMFGFGKWIMGSEILLLGLNRGDDAFVGWFLGASALGIYQQAFRFSNAPATELTHVISKVAFPGFVEMAQDTQKLGEGFFRTFRGVSLLSVPMATGIALVAPAFVRGVLGAQWVAMIPVVRVFAAWGLLRSLVALCGPLFRAVNHPEYSTIMQLTRLGLLAAFIYPATAMWGSAGAAAAVLASGVVQNPVALWLAVRTLDSSPYRLLRTLASPVGASLVMAGAVLAVTAALTGLSPTALFLTQVLVGVIAYGAVLAVGERTVGLGLARDAALLRDGLS